MFSPAAMGAVFRREARVYFTSPIAYTVTVIFLLLSGYFYYSNFNQFALLSFQAGKNAYLLTLNVNEVTLAPTFGAMAVVLMFISPLLTMRLLAEEKKAGTFELIMSYPLRESEILIGKFLAGWFFYLVMLLPTLVYPGLAVLLAPTDLGPVITAYIGLLLLGAAFISLGLFASSITENQIVAAVIGLGGLMLLWLVGGAGQGSSARLAALLADLSVIAHFDSFHQGMIDSHDVVYYLLFTVFFLVLTGRNLGSSRWRG